MTPRDASGGSTREVEVEVLEVESEACGRCNETAAHVEAALAALAPVLAAIGVRARGRRTRVESEAEARARGFVASPTVRVDGRDVVADVTEEPCRDCSDVCGTGVTCRTFSQDGVASPSVPTARIVDAVLRAVYAPATLPPRAVPLEKVPENLVRFFAGRAARTAARPLPVVPAASACCEAPAPLQRAERPRGSRGRCCEDPSAKAASPGLLGVPTRAVRSTGQGGGSGDADIEV